MCMGLWFVVDDLGLTIYDWWFLFKFSVLEPLAEYGWTSCSQIVSAIQWFMVDGLCSLFCHKQLGNGHELFMIDCLCSLFFNPELSILLLDGLNPPVIYGWWFMVDCLWSMFMVEDLVDGLYVVDSYG